MYNFSADSFLYEQTWSLFNILFNNLAINLFIYILMCFILINYSYFGCNFGCKTWKVQCYWFCIKFMVMFRFEQNYWKYFNERLLYNHPFLRKQNVLSNLKKKKLLKNKEILRFFQFMIMYQKRNHKDNLSYNVKMLCTIEFFFYNRVYIFKNIGNLLTPYLWLLKNISLSLHIH